MKGSARAVTSAIRPDIVRRILACVCVIALMSLVLLAGDSGCYVKSVFGVPCPGCGMTRAWMSALNGNIAKAFAFHPLFPVPAVIAGLFPFRYRFSRIWRSARFWVPVAVLFMSVYAVRMYRFFPDTPPFDFNPDAILVRLAHMIGSII